MHSQTGDMVKAHKDLYLDYDLDADRHLQNVSEQSNAPPSSECFRMIVYFDKPWGLFSNY